MVTGPAALSVDPPEPQAATAASDVSAMARVAALNGRDFMGEVLISAYRGRGLDPGAVVGDPPNAAGC